LQRPAIHSGKRLAEPSESHFAHLAEQGLPIKPDVLMEGGNVAINPAKGDASLRECVSQLTHILLALLTGIAIILKL
jgi:hypothetical protein